MSSLDSSHKLHFWNQQRAWLPSQTHFRRKLSDSSQNRSESKRWSDSSTVYLRIHLLNQRVQTTLVYNVTLRDIVKM